jgi:hypothetical protein
MPRGGKRAGAGRKPKIATGLTEGDIIRVLRSPRSIEKLFELRLKKFGLTRTQYEAMLSEQKGRCAICEEPLSGGWVIDHCHMTMRVRGLVHPKCNTFIGFGNEDPKRFDMAVKYLKRHNQFL